MQATRPLARQFARRISQVAALAHPEVEAAPVASTSAAVKSLFLATLPWRDSATESHRLDGSFASALQDGKDIIASSVSTVANRLSPLASSLGLSTGKVREALRASGGGAWLLVRAEDPEDALALLRRRFSSSAVQAASTHAGPAGALDLDRVSVQSISLGDSTHEDGPLYEQARAAAAAAQYAAASATSGVVSVNGPLYGKRDPNAVDVETNGPLYGK